MLPHIHFLSGLILGGILFYFFPEIGLFGFLLIAISGVLIDVDHYFFYAYKKRDLNLIKAVQWFFDKEIFLKNLPREKRGEHFREVYIFHGIEIILLLFFVGIYFNRWFLLVNLSFMLHLSLDYIYQIKIWERLDKVSIVYDFIKFKK